MHEGCLEPWWEREAGWDDLKLILAIPREHSIGCLQQHDAFVKAVMNNNMANDAKRKTSYSLEGSQKGFRKGSQKVDLLQFLKSASICTLTAKESDTPKDIRTIRLQ